MVTESCADCLSPENDAWFQSRVPTFRWISWIFGKSFTCTFISPCHLSDSFFSFRKYTLGIGLVAQHCLTPVLRYTLILNRLSLSPNQNTKCLLKQMPLDGNWAEISHKFRRPYVLSSKHGENEKSILHNSWQLTSSIASFAWQVKLNVWPHSWSISLWNFFRLRLWHNS